MPVLWTNFKIAAFLFFGWFVLDSVYSVLLGSPLEGIYYPAASGRLKNVPYNWANKPWFAAPMYLAVFASLWIILLKKGGLKGLRIAAIITAFTMLPFWVVSAVSADMYELTINKLWLFTMIYSNLSFFIFGTVGKGRSEDLSF
jgi:hypothetical protein